MRIESWHLGLGMEERGWWGTGQWRGPRDTPCLWRQLSGTRSPGGGFEASWAQLALASLSWTKFTFSACSSAQGWSQDYFPKSDRLLLLAKLYLIQWVFFPLYSRFSKCNKL